MSILLECIFLALWNKLSKSEARQDSTTVSAKFSTVESSFVKSHKAGPTRAFLIKFLHRLANFSSLHVKKRIQKYLQGHMLQCCLGLGISCAKIEEHSFWQCH